LGRLRILLLAPDANPESNWASLIGYSEAQALAQLHDVTIVVRPSVEQAVRGKQGAIRSVEVVRVHRLERTIEWVLRRIFKNDFMTHAQSITAFVGYPFAIALELQTWKQMRTRIKAGEFDIVLRLLPVSAVVPSAIAHFLRSGPIPFVIGPISGGLPWPSGFSQANNHKQWISGLRGLYRYMPFARSTYRNAAAIIAGASQTYEEFAQYREKLFFVLENGVDRSLCSGDARALKRDDKLELIFAGSLSPIKGCDLALRGAASLLQSGLAHFTVVGDGPERNRLEQLVRTLGVDKEVSFCGWLSHHETMQRLRSADIMVFPSIRDNSPAVVFEALAAGAVPVVADFGGPGDTVRPGVGYKVRLTNEADVVAQIEQVLRELSQDRDLLERLRQQAVSYARESLSWDAKAQAFTSILHWALRQGPKPNLPPPKAYAYEACEPILKGVAQQYEGDTHNEAC
jgi:glycosyltransferase involved in cell wall biosynthesis